MAALALALMISLTGCATIFGTSHPHTKAPASSGLVGKAAHNAPKVGSCWHGVDPQGSPQVGWYLEDRSAPVNCSTPHQLYTIAVLPLPKDTPNVEASGGQLNSYVYTPAEQACVAYIKKSVGSPDAQNGRFEYKAYLPSKADWNAGARWVRCDLTVFKVGSLVTAPQLENLPSLATLKRQLRAHDFDLCTNVPGGTVAAGPRAAGAVFASCTNNPEWTFFRYFGDDASNPSYPTASEFKAQFEAQCAPFGAASGALAVPLYPSAEDWANGEHGFECWGTPK